MKSMMGGASYDEFAGFRTGFCVWMKKCVRNRYPIVREENGVFTAFVKYFRIGTECVFI